MIIHLENTAAWIVAVAGISAVIGVYLWILAFIARLAGEAGREHARRHLTIVELKRISWSAKPKPDWDAQLIQQSHRVTRH